MGQFKVLHQYLNNAGLVNSWLLCSQNTYNRNKDNVDNLLPFRPHGNKLISENNFYYTKKLETVSRCSLGYIVAIKKHLAQHSLDLIVCHGTAGAPLMLFDEFNIPIISYIEFPSFKAHGWDPQYPPPVEKIRRDRNFEMLSFYNVFKSYCTITPSRYAKSLFPHDLQKKIIPQMEGFLFDDKIVPSSKKTDTVKTIGFCARDLSSAKGLEHFLIVSKKLIAVNSSLHFIIIGSTKLLYSYEQHFIDKKYGSGSKVTFLDYLIEREDLNLSYYTFTGKLSYTKYVEMIDKIDLFHYPIQYSSASWGLFELLSRGKIIIGSERCYVPEILKDGKNGFIVKYGEYTGWVSKTLEILSSLENFYFIERSALETAQNYTIDKVAPKFMTIFDDVINRKDIKC